MGKWKKWRKSHKYDDIYVAPHRDEGTQTTIRYVDKDGKVSDEDEYENSLDWSPYKSSRQIGFGYSGKNNWDNDYGYYRSTYSSVRDYDNEIIDHHIPYFDMREANEYVQRRIGEWLENIGYEQYKHALGLIKRAEIPKLSEKPLDHAMGSKFGSQSKYGSSLFNKKTTIKNYVVNDMYAVYFESEYAVKSLKKPEHQKWFNILAQLNNYLLKVISNGNSVYSGIVVFHIIKNLLQSGQADDMIDGENADNKELKSFMDAIQKGQWKPYDGRTGKAEYMAKADKNMQKMLTDALKQAAEEISEREKLDKLFGNTAGLQDEVDREELSKMINLNRVDGKVLAKFIKGIIKNTKKSTGGAKPQFKEESLLDADTIEDILDLELLPYSPLVEDMEVHDVKYTQKFDVYMDASGSMEASVYLNEDTGEVNTSKKNENDVVVKRIALAKLVYYKMYSMNLVNECYKFTTQPKKLTHEQMMKCRADGGTTIENVILHVEKKTHNPSLIISDLQDWINTYSNKIFILGIEGTVSNHAEKPFQSFINNKQVKILNNGYVRDYYVAFPHLKGSKKQDLPW